MTKKKDDQEITVDKKALLNTLTDPKFIEKLTGRIALHYTLGAIREDHPSKEEEKKMFDMIEALKNNPQILQTWIKQNENIEQNEVITEDIAPQEVFTAAQSMLSIAKKEYRKEIATALEEYPNNKVTLSTNADFLWNVILAALLLEPSMEYMEELADKLEISADKLADVGKKAKAIEKEEYLPGLEPSTKEQVKNLLLPPIPAIDYTKSILKATSKLNRKIGFVMNIQNQPVPLDIPNNIPLDKSKRCIYFSLTQFTAPDGKPQTITPYDQEVENTLSNLFEDGNGEVTSQQIYCKMNGITSKGKRVTPAALAEIDSSIRKLNRTYADFYIVENIDGEKRERRIMDGHILDTFYVKDCFLSSGKVKAGWRSTRPGILYLAEKAQNNRLVTIEPKQLNLLDSGIQLTPLSIAIRRFCLDEIFRISATGSYKTTKNKFLLDRFYTYDRDPALTEIITPPNGVGIIEVKLKTGANAKEQNRIRQAKFIRRNLLQDILEHLKITGALKDWDFVEKEKILPYKFIEDDRNPGRKKRKYSTKDIAAADGVLLDVSKTTGASKRIATTERIKQDNEKAKRREKNNQE